MNTTTSLVWEWEGLSLSRWQQCGLQTDYRETQKRPAPVHGCRFQNLSQVRNAAASISLPKAGGEEGIWMHGFNPFTLCSRTDFSLKYHLMRPKAFQGGRVLNKNKKQLLILNSHYSLHWDLPSGFCSCHLVSLANSYGSLFFLLESPLVLGAVCSCLQLPGGCKWGAWYKKLVHSLLNVYKKAKKIFTWSLG